MATISNWVAAARLRTLPLSASVVLSGAALAYVPGFFPWKIFALCLSTTFLLQILSNFANDYGDYASGTDNDQRVGPARTMQQGLITARQMKIAMITMVVLILISGITLLWVVFGAEKFPMAVLFLVLGLACIGAAIKYTVGKSAYGYRGLGDIAVFIFFGLTGVAGSAYLYWQQLHWSFFLVAFTIGALSAAVLNVNNMRDVVNDKQHGKNTLVVRMGLPAARKYHLTLVFLALASMLMYAVYAGGAWYTYLFLFTFPVFILDVVKLQRVPSENMDPFLKRTAIFTFSLAVLFFIGKLIG